MLDSLSFNNMHSSYAPFSGCTKCQYPLIAMLKLTKVLRGKIKINHSPFATGISLASLLTTKLKCLFKKHISQLTKWTLSVFTKTYLLSSTLLDDKNLENPRL